MRSNEKIYKVKLCGTTSIRDAQMAAGAGADYLGVLVDVPGSERSLSLDRALAIAESSRIPVVVLLSGKDVEGVISVVKVLQPFAVHLLGEMPCQAIRDLKEKLGCQRCQIWQTVYLPARGQTEVDTGALKRSMQNYEQAGADAIVIDTMSLAADGTVDRYGGTGKVCDWDAAKELVASVQVPVFLAGGIDPDNVREAILRVDPYGVDLATGVEESKGKRDPERVERLMREVSLINQATTRSLTILSHSPECTKNIGEEIGRRAHQGSVIALCGDLGTGKTVFAQGVAAGLGVKAIVTSPTFVIINEYEGRHPFYHVDTYRLTSSEDMQELGYEEYFYGDGVTVIEWAQKIEDLLPEECLRVELRVTGESDREIVLIPFGQRYIGLVEDIAISFQQSAVSL
jgi:tRNA threonylcarbamoyl adenosine modification protein YjeE